MGSVQRRSEYCTFRTLQRNNQISKHMLQKSMWILYRFGTYCSECDTFRTHQVEVPQEMLMDYYRMCKQNIWDVKLRLQLRIDAKAQLKAEKKAGLNVSQVNGNLVITSLYRHQPL